MTAEQLLARLLSQGAAVWIPDIGFAVLAHAELVPLGLFFVALPAHDQSDAHTIEGAPEILPGDMLRVVRDGATVATVATLADTPELNTDDAIEELAEWKVNRSESAWRHFVEVSRPK